MNNRFVFTFDYLQAQYEAALAGGIFFSCYDYFLKKASDLREKSIVNRVDIDFSVKKAERLGKIFVKLGIPATFFIRLHAPEYNPFSFENYRIIKFLKESGFEIGYHSETVDAATIWNEDQKACFLRDLEVFNRAFGVESKGTACHGGMTGLNNLDFWKDKKASDFGLAYEAYDKQPGFNLFDESFYISDSEWIRWKCYNKGVLQQGDNRSLAEHASDGHSLIYLLIHSDTYFDRHFYE